MTEQDFQYAHDQYYLAIINDGALYGKLQKLLRESRFTAFAGVVDDHIEYLRVRHSLDKADINDRVYIRLKVIEYLLTPFEVKQLFNSEPKLHNNHTEFCRKQNMMWLIDRLLGLPVVKTQPATQPEATKENIMASIEIKNITYINNTDVTTLSDEQLIDAIKTIEKEIADLEAVKTESSKVKTKISGLHETLTKVVSILDAR